MKAFAGIRKRIAVAKFITKALLQPGRQWSTIFDSHTGAWQQDHEIELDSVLTFSAVFACIRLITSDIGKLGLKLVQLQSTGIWREIKDERFSPVLRKPNSTQTRIKFFEQWVTSKLIHGNAYVLKIRADGDRVTGLRVLDPTRVQALVSESGDVFYRLRTDHLSLIPEEVTVPAREIIHDTHVCPEHPLVGVSPIGACGMSAAQGLKIQKNSQKFFANMSRPSGMLTAPGSISDDTASRLKVAWNENFGGDKIGNLAVLGDGLQYEAMTISAQDSQLIEQLNWTAEDVCRAFGVPAYKVGVGQMPAYNNINALDQAYYSQTLQELIECIELLLDEGLGLPENMGTQFDLDDLLRMDSLTKAQILKEKIGAGYMAPNEARAKDGLEPVTGGNTPYLQVQNYSLAALKSRDMRDQEGSSDIQAEAMNGAQVTSLQGLITAASLGQIPVETVRAAIHAAFPLLTSDQVDQMVSPLAALASDSSGDGDEPPEDEFADDAQMHLEASRISNQFKMQVMEL